MYIGGRHHQPELEKESDGEIDKRSHFWPKGFPKKWRQEWANATKAQAKTRTTSRATARRAEA